MNLGIISFIMYIQSHIVCKRGTLGSVGITEISIAKRSGDSVSLDIKIIPDIKLQK